ncbi:MAG: iron dicitrate transporter, partial [Marivirga sp.]|nr:iron dicitrate transporter [Marivirga sp.]
MRSKVCSTIIFCFLSATVFAQYRLSGTVISQEDSTALKECVVYLNDGKKSSVTDNRGKFLFEDLANGDYVLHFTSLEFKYFKTTITIADNDQYIRISLEPNNKVLEEIIITDASSNFGFTRMRAVENMGIYEGKKSEVIIPEQLVANLSTNNARQIYSRVAGLNIWENDGAGLQLSIGARGLDPNRSSNF